ncbi:hypothetical protein WN59_12940 [Salinicoccus sediminis]|uniref:Cytochrome b561 bacterial/Ni-hydrogenase domain-containing protein n=1 Tax=Salinicoccus sediminis TaxID=1432562 RepID=A0A0M2SDY8_9STAP|nr:hypothetical protein [Salinicoccus sediminis]KKK32944.1 hypothetical protein WN59_12940 [Salinicoccus sediminis]
MSVWFLFNAALLLWAVWNVTAGLSTHTTYVHIILGFAGFLFFIFNWTRNAVFSTIRNVESRAVKVKLARMSKRIVPYHRWTGTTALILIMLHGMSVISFYSFDLSNMKILTGMLAALNLLILVLSGWYRLLFDSSLKIRRLHIGLGISMFCLTVLHFIF